MEAKRVREIQQLVEACSNTDSTDLEAEKTEAICELLAAVEALEREHQPVRD